MNTIALKKSSIKSVVTQTKFKGRISASSIFNQKRLYLFCNTKVSATNLCAKNFNSEV
jgi:hypothetical protein